MLDASLLAFVDLENQVDAVVRPVDNFRGDLDVEAAVALINLDDALGVGLHRSARQRAALLGLDLLRQLLILDAVIAFEVDPVDDRSLDHCHNELAAGLVDLDVFEQAGGVERFERRVDRGGIETPVGARLEIGAHRIGLDTAVALDDDRAGSKTGIGRSGVSRTPDTSK